MTLLSWLFYLPIALFPPDDAAKVSRMQKANEPSVAISLKNKDVIVAGSNLNWVYRSADGGKTWQSQQLKSVYGVYGDPVVVAGGEGRFYYFHLAKPKEGHWLDRIVCQRSDDEGLTWNDGSFAGLNGEKHQDKPWVEIIPGLKNDVLFLSWTEFDKYGSREANHQSRIRYAFSGDNGETWSAAETISLTQGDCIDSSLTNEGAVPYLADKQKLCVVWAGPAGLVERCLNLNTNQWMPVEEVLEPFEGGWSDTISGIYRSNGLPFTESSYPLKKVHYVVWSERQPGTKDSQVYLKVKKGKRWEKSRIAVTASDGVHESFMPAIKSDGKTGALCIVFYKRNVLTKKVEPMLALSHNQGKTFQYHSLYEPFDTDQSVFFGDYMGIDLRNEVAVIVFTVFEGSETEIYCKKINLH